VLARCLGRRGAWLCRPHLLLIAVILFLGGHDPPPRPASSRSAR